MSGETVLDLFVSSPGDVQRERERVDFVVERLNAEFAGRARIRTIRWETRYYSSHDTFQAQIPEASACDLVLAIFGARLGSPLPATFPTMPSGETYPSGTAYEVLSAIEARQKGQGIPDIYVFRRPIAPLVAVDAPNREEVEGQWRRVTAFFETWFRNRGGQFLAAFQEFTTTDEFAAKAEDCLRQWLARRGFPTKTAKWDRLKLGPPYPGLAAFDESRQSVFFGRSLVIDQAIRRLREVEAPANDGGRAPFLLLIGASGSGKSSLLSAGLMPRVGMPGVLPDVDLWRRAVTTPGLDPFLSLAESLLSPEALGPELALGPFRSREILGKQLGGDPDAAAAVLHSALGTAAEARRRESNFDQPRPARLFLAIDQAERLLIETPPDLQRRFADLIAALCRHRVASVVFSLRSDAYARFQALDALVALRDAGATLDLLPATQSELEEMATRPAALCEPPLEFERLDGRSLAAVLVADARGGDALPLLQMTLARLSAAEAARGDGVLRFADYHGLGAAVTQTANEALAGLEPAARAQLANLIAGLVRDFAADPLTGKPTPMIGALDRARFEAGRPERKALVEAFVAQRLLTAEGDAASERVRPTHESLLRIWPEAVAIIEEAAHHIRTRAALEPIVREWAEARAEDKARHLEISPALLEGAVAYVERFGDEVSPDNREFVAEAARVDAAKRERERQEQERRIADAEAIARANRRIARVTGIGLVAALVLAALAGWEWRSTLIAQREAQAQRDRAERTLTAATQTADGLVFDLAQKFRNVTGVPTNVVKDILDQARKLQEQLLNTGESTKKLTANHAAALGEIAITELALGDTSAALALAQQSRDIYAKLLEAAPDDFKDIHDLDFTDRTLGDILQRQGKLTEAEAALNRARETVEAATKRGVKETQLQQDLSVILEDLGSLARARGDYAGALKLFGEGLAKAQALADAQPDDQASRHGLAVAQRNVGDALLELGKIDEAAAAFDKSSEIAHRLALENRDNALLQRDYSLSQERLGETLTAKHDYAGALKAFSDGEDTAIALAATDKANEEWQYDISIGHIEVGDAQLALSDFGDAIQSYRDAVAIDKALTTKDPTNAAWRTHYRDALDRLGDALYKHSGPADVLPVFRDALAVYQDNLARNPADADWAQSVVQADGKIGDALLGLGKDDDALAAFRAALSGARALGATKAGRNLVYVNLARIGGALSLKGDAASALTTYAEAELLVRGLVAEDPKAAGPRGQLAALLVSEAHMQTRVGRSQDAIAGLREAAALARQLSLDKPDEPLWPREAAVAYDRLGDALRETGDVPGALAAYRESLAVAAAQPAPMRSDPDLQLTVALTQEAVAPILEGQKDVAGALEALQAALPLRRDLADKSPNDRINRRFQLLDENGVGRLLTASGKAKDALDAFRDGLAVARDLASRPGADETARSDLAISLFLIGTSLVQAGDRPAAAADLAEALPIAQALAKAAPANAQYAREAWFVASNLGDARAAINDLSGAVQAYLAARDAAKALVALGAADKNADPVRASVAKIGLVANSMLLARDYKGALAALENVTAVVPEQNWLDLVRAASLMFLDRPDEARALYDKHRGETTYGGKTWEAATTEGFAVLKGKGMTSPLMDEIEASFATAKAGP